MSKSGQKKKAPGARVRKKATDHHRRATSVGGSNHVDNRIYVASDIHEQYHDVFLNLCVPQAVIVLNKFIKRGNIRVVAVRSQSPLHPFECPDTHKFGSRMIGCCSTYFDRHTKLTKRRVRRFRELMATIALEIGEESSQSDRVRYIIEHLFDPDYSESYIELIDTALE